MGKRGLIIEQDMEDIFSLRDDWRRFSGKGILVTGAAGLLAAYLVEFFAWLNQMWPGDPICLYVLARDEKKLRNRFPHLISCPWFVPVVQDVCDPLLIEAPIDFIIHAASPSSPKYYLQHPVSTIRTNTLGTMNMLELARENGARLLFMSSGAVYGHGNSQSAIDETDFGTQDPLEIYACYSESKRLCETLCAAYFRQHGVQAVIARISHTYGPGIDLNDGRVFSDFISDSLAGRDIRLHSQGTSSRPFCYIADVTFAFLILLLEGNAGDAYNVGMDSEITIFDLAKLIAGISSREGTMVLLPEGDNKTTEIRASGHFDITKMRKLGWYPKTTPEIGFRRVLSHFRNI